MTVQHGLSGLGRYGSVSMARRKLLLSKQSSTAFQGTKDMPLMGDDFRAPTAVA
jgi:hypothetical protein